MKGRAHSLHYWEHLCIHLHVRHQVLRWMSAGDNNDDGGSVSKCRFTITVFLPPCNVRPVYLLPPSLSFPKTATCVLILLPLDPLCLQKRSAFHWDPTWTNEGKGQPPTGKTVKQADKSALGDPLLNGKKVVISCLHKTMNHLWMDVAPWCFKWTGLGWKDRIWGPHWAWGR